MVSTRKTTNMSNANGGWIAVDLDGTLAHYTGWQGAQHIGEPIAPMLERVRNWLAAGKTVKIFTARMHGHGMPIIGGGVEDAKTPIEDWCVKHLGVKLEITNVKDFGMIELWDDRAIQVESNTGIPVASCKARKRRIQLTPRKGANDPDQLSGDSNQKHK